MVNVNFGWSKSIIIIFTKIIFAIEIEFAKSAKFTACENFALYGTGNDNRLHLVICTAYNHNNNNTI